MTQLKVSQDVPLIQLENYPVHRMGGQLAQFFSQAGSMIEGMFATYRAPIVYIDFEDFMQRNEFTRNYIARRIQTYTRDFQIARQVYSDAMAFNQDLINRNVLSLLRLWVRGRQSS